jgi:anaerobic nitric oxide reductase flavorubredoxin
MKPIELKPGIFWVGVVDWAIRDFHGYVTPKGTTYNNYLILDEEPTLIDGVKAEFADLSMRRIRVLIELQRIKHLVVNHIEPDHGGALPAFIKELPAGVPVYCTEKGMKGLSRFHDTTGWNFKIVKTGNTLKLGKRTLLFIETPMIHWPDSMMTYVKEDRLLISQDAFGQHLASTQRFDDEFIECASEALLIEHVWDYYANILMPLGTLINSKLNELPKLDVSPDMIAPDHGVIWRDPAKIIGLYKDMIEGRCSERVVIIYDSMWGNTGNMVQSITEGLTAEGMDSRAIKLRGTPVSEAIKEFWMARGALIGTPTLNNKIFHPVAQFLSYLEGLRPKGRIVSAFGSYGWGGGAVKEVIQKMRDLKLEVFEEGLQANYRPGPEDDEAAYEFGRRFALATREYHIKF